MKPCIVQLQFEGAQAEALRSIPGNRSAFARRAIALAFAAQTGSDFPEAAQKTRGVAGSRLPEARALGLSTGEYQRRVKVLAKAGVAVTPEAVAGVPPLPQRTPAA